MESETTQLNLLKQRIPYDVNIFGDNATYEEVLNNLLEDSKYIALSIRFPYNTDYSNIELPSKYNNWQLRCSVELYGLLGKMDVLSYSENGVSWTRDSSNISKSLLTEITPKVGVVNVTSE